MGGVERALNTFKNRRMPLLYSMLSSSVDEPGLPMTQWSARHNGYVNKG